VPCGAFVKCMSDKFFNGGIGDLVRFKEPAMGLTFDENGGNPFYIEPGDVGMIIKIGPVDDKKQFELFESVELMIRKWVVDVSAYHFVNKPLSYEVIDVDK